MKCSECSTEIKPVVAIDIDGTLADYHGHFLSFVEHYICHRGIHDYGGDVPFKQWVCENYRIDEGIWYDIKLAYRQGAQKRSAPMYPDAERLTWLVREAGAEIWLTTTRPYLRLDNVDPDTRFWLDHRQIVWDYLLYGKDKMGMLADRVDRERVVAVLDDLPQQYDRAWQIYGKGVPLLNKTKWNDAVHRENEIHGLDYAALEIGNRIRDWKELHA